jgi:D-lactate dehydrogenase
MSIKMVCYGVRDNEKPLFTTLNRYNFELTLLSELLTEENIDSVKGHEAVLLRGNCNARAANLMKMKEYGVKYLLTRTVGYDHIDVPKAKELGFKTARVPHYSPNAIAELAVSLALMLVRHTGEMVHNTALNKDFRVLPNYFSREIRNMTVGIVGTGYIGLTAARLFKGLGAQVLGYDPVQSKEAAQVVSFTPSLKDLVRESDLVSLHLPFIKDKNHHMVNAALLSEMKSDAVLINTARGELVETAAVIEAIKHNTLGGYGTDVVENEAAFFNRKWETADMADINWQLQSLYPRVIITPHIGSNTDEACRNMIEQSYDNLNDYLTTDFCANAL